MLIGILRQSISKRKACWSWTIKVYCSMSRHSNYEYREQCWTPEIYAKRRSMHNTTAILHHLDLPSSARPSISAADGSCSSGKYCSRPPQSMLFARNWSIFGSLMLLLGSGGVEMFDCPDPGNDCPRCCSGDCDPPLREECS